MPWFLSFATNTKTAEDPYWGIKRGFLSLWVQTLEKQRFKGPKRQ